MRGSSDDSTPSPASTPELAAMRVDGFSIVRSAIPIDLANRLKEGVRDHFRTSGRMQYGGKFQLRGLNVRPDLAEILLSEPVIEVIRRHVTPGAMLLTGECDLMMNTTSSWHKDITPDMRLGPDLYADTGFAVYKMAIYLQDQDDASPAAFRVRPGSHLCLDGKGMAETRLGTHVGDVVVFDVRLDHAGQPQTFSDRILHRVTKVLAPSLGGDPEAWFTRLRMLLARLGGKSERLAVFLTFGPDAPATRAYEEAGRHRHGAATAPLSAGATAAAVRLGIAMIGTEGDRSPRPV